MEPRSQHQTREALIQAHARISEVERACRAAVANCQRSCDERQRKVERGIAEYLESKLMPSQALRVVVETIHTGRWEAENG